MSALATRDGLETPMMGTTLERKEAIKNADPTKSGKVLMKQCSRASEELEKMCLFGETKSSYLVRAFRGNDM